MAGYYFENFKITNIARTTATASIDLNTNDGAYYINQHKKEEWETYTNDVPETEEVRRLYHAGIGLLAPVIIYNGTIATNTVSLTNLASGGRHTGVFGGSITVYWTVYSLTGFEQKIYAYKQKDDLDNPIYKDVLDENGDPIPIYENVLDENGDPIPIYEPVLDEDGNPVMENGEIKTEIVGYEQEIVGYEQEIVGYEQIDDLTKPLYTDNLSKPIYSTQFQSQTYTIPNSNTLTFYTAPGLSGGASLGGDQNFYFKSTGSPSSGEKWLLSDGIDSLLDNIGIFSDFAKAWVKWRDQADTSITVNWTENALHAGCISGEGVTNIYSALGEPASYLRNTPIYASMFTGLESIVNQHTGKQVPV